MEEVRRVETTQKRKKGMTILLIIAGILGLALIIAAIYFYAIGDTDKKETTSQVTCACYYIDPDVISECGDPRRGFMFETLTVPADQTCRAACATSKLSVNLLNSTTKQDLYQICHLQTVLDTRCSQMTIKDKDGKIVTGRISSDNELTVEAVFDKEYTEQKFVINNQDTDPDSISPDKLTIKKTITDLSSSTISISATATDQNGDQINSPLCRRLIEITQVGTTNVNDVQIQTRKDTETYKISRIKIGIGNISEEDSLDIKFIFDTGYSELTMNKGFTIDTSKGEIIMIEQDLYNSENFTEEKTFSQFDNKEGNINVKVEISDVTGLVGSTNGSFVLPEFTEETGGKEQTIEESNFYVSKASSSQCVEKTEPNNTVSFTLSAKNNSTVTQNIKSVKDKLPLGFTYIANSTKINGISVSDSDYVTVTKVGETEEIVWTKTAEWEVTSGQTLNILFQSKAQSNTLVGANQNEVIITPTEIPSDPSTLRAEYVIQVADDCDNIQETEEQDTTPTTGIFDSTIGKLFLGLIVITLGWYIYSKPMGKTIVEKLVRTEAYQEAEMTSWKIFNPKKYFEAKVVKEVTKKK